MKLKSLLFGSAAVMAAGTGAAQAADLPIVEPVEYVRICDAFGTGFYYIPGTDTCLKVGGYVRVESHYVNGDTDILFGVPEGAVNNWTTRARGQVNLDARTQSDFGLVRAYIALEMTVGPGSDTGDDGIINADGIGDPNYAGSNPNVAAAFVQISNDWGTYTAGHTGSFFDFFGSHGYGTRLNIDDNTTEQTLFAWTFAGGNGFSFTIAAEDPASSGRKLNGDDDYEGQEAPDGVVNIRVDQGWGSAQVMAALRHIHDYEGGNGDFDGNGSDDGFGFAAGAGLSIGIPGGWSLDAEGGYSEGALGYITTDPGGIGDIDGPDPDDLNTAWMIRGGITGPVLSPNITVWLDGSFTHVEEEDDNDEYDFWAVVAGGRWEPVPGLYMGPEFAFNSLDGDDAGEDYDVWGAMWRVQRSF
jgi:hypothetical protein